MLGTYNMEQCIFYSYTVCFFLYSRKCIELWYDVWLLLLVENRNIWDVDENEKKYYINNKHKWFKKMKYIYLVHFLNFLLLLLTTNPLIHPLFSPTHTYFVYHLFCVVIIFCHKYNECFNVFFVHERFEHTHTQYLYQQHELWFCCCIYVV